ncbi:cytochrome c oxidase subunit 6C [Aplysia californica]|uniref:Cytochrome c oxidase subunit 6C n=1 Tax=Aplysia californica TaxID=6500 RepID=A0ABM0KAD7_APLCA|nr:cytochrome c oxidase subunit 6C [Aplysia californica]
MASKPVLRNLLLSKTKRDFVIALTVSIAVAMSYKFGVQEQRRQKFENFYKTYDVEKDYARMKKAGVFQSINTMVEEGRYEG